MQDPFDVYLLDTSNYQFVSVVSACVESSSTKCISRVKNKPNVDSKFKLYLLSNGKVALQASNGKYLSRIAYGDDPFNHLNFIQPAKSTLDHPSQFDFDYDPEGGPFENLGTIALKADNGRYVAPFRGTFFRPLATNPYRFLLMPAKSTAEKQVIPQKYQGWIN